MKEFPRLMMPAMVQATLEGRKHMTRRMDGLGEINCRPGVWVYTKLADGSHRFDHATLSAAPVVIRPSCRPGDRIWVRETHRLLSVGGACVDTVLYKASPGIVLSARGAPGSFQWVLETVNDQVLSMMGVVAKGDTRWRPSIHLQREHARIILEVTAEERCERVREISRADSLAEGLATLTKDGGQTWKFGVPDRDGLPGNDDCGWHWKEWSQNPCVAFGTLWDKVHGPGAWDRNEWVRVIQFKVIEPDCGRFHPADVFKAATGFEPPGFRAYCDELVPDPEARS